jgi:anti-sigma regulatory factor (Ser/Thr protein kinase)
VTATTLDRANDLVHDAFFYTDASSYRAGLLDFIRTGLAGDEPVLVAVPQPGLSLVRSALTADEEPRVRTADMAVAGRNPGRIIGTVLSAFVREHTGRRVRIIGEPIWAGRSAEEYPACAEHEALINVALGSSPAYILCPYDATHLDRSVLVDATRTHPILASGPDRWPSPGYTDSKAVAASFDRPLSASPAHAVFMVIAPSTAPRSARQFVQDYAERARMSAQRAADLCLVAQELTINTLVHAGARGLLTIWAANDEVVCQVQDGGRIDDPLVGRRAPGPADVGHGLFAVHQVSDLVRVHRRSEGTTVRVHIGLN